jgi:hypothetical protein
MKKYHLTFVLLTFLFIGFTSIAAKADTIATFADPSKNSNNPLFTVNFTALTLDGSWPDTKTGLTLQFTYNGNNFTDAWFDVDGSVALSPIIPNTLYTTGPGTINFYQDNTSTDPLMIINFNGGTVSLNNFGAGQLVGQDVTFTGSEITGSFSQEQFSFSFVNTALLPGNDAGFTATAAFTSSAVPEPATICLLCLGAMSLIKREKR